jgi:hypothetical protein
VTAKIIALTGLAGSGKSTVAEMIGGMQLAFAQPMKEFCAQLFGFDDAQLYGPSSERERPSPYFRRPNGEPLTPRYALQTLGTEWGRNCDPDVWVKAGVQRALRLAEDAGNPLHSIVITDLRFVNEARAVREAGGQVWRVDRPGLMRGNHPSELEIWSREMDRLVTHEISNTGSLDHLARAVRAARAP